jgi:hypothetical protein
VRVISRIFFNRVAVATVKSITDTTTVGLEPHLLIASNSVEDRSSAHTAAACAMVNPLLTTTAAGLRRMDHRHVRRVLLVIAFATCTLILSHFLKVRFTFATTFIVFTNVHKKLHSNIRGAR